MKNDTGQARINRNDGNRHPYNILCRFARHRDEFHSFQHDDDTSDSDVYNAQPRELEGFATSMGIVRRIYYHKEPMRHRIAR